jgi:hypothetical protein
VGVSVGHLGSEDARQHGKPGSQSAAGLAYIVETFEIDAPNSVQPRRSGNLFISPDPT